MRNASLKGNSSGGSGGNLLSKERRNALATAIAANGFGEIPQNVTPLHPARLRYGQQTCSGDFSVIAAIPKAGLAPLHCYPEYSLGDIVGRFHIIPFQEQKQTLEVKK